ncbi:MAG: hypothetical protein B9S32_12630 [Verrucomicrobia bacterium Tous-C9LFEB]|nr:MAG: hypothetical protein B9S32_12630 [Verrucomicrobia bacterium Tous-C9LFEB]
MHDRVLRLLPGALFFVAIFMVGVAGSKPPQSTFRVHVQTVEQGAPGTQILPVSLLNPPKQIMIRAQPELSERDILKVESAPTESGGVALRLTLSEHGSTVLNAVTTDNQGRILVFFVNGRVVYAPVIDKIINDGIVIIPGAVAAEEVKPLEEAAKAARK